MHWRCNQTERFGHGEQTVRVSLAVGRMSNTKYSVQVSSITTGCVVAAGRFHSLALACKRERDELGNEFAGQLGIRRCLLISQSARVRRYVSNVVSVAAGHTIACSNRQRPRYGSWGDIRTANWRDGYDVPSRLHH